RKEQEATPAAEPFKLAQFKNVKSRFSSTPTGQVRRESRPESSEKGASPGPGRDFLRKGSRETVPNELRREAIRRRRQLESPTNTNTNSKLIGTRSRTSPTATLDTPPPLNTAHATWAPTAVASSAYSTSPSPNHRNRAPSSGELINCDDDHGAQGRQRCSLSSADMRRRSEGGQSVSKVSEQFGMMTTTTPRKEPVPRASDVAKLAPRLERDFVASNRLQATEMKTKQLTEPESHFTHDSYGRVPDYLVSRQEEWEREEERRKAEAPDPTCPPGMKVMPEEERLSTLRLLAENEASCQAQLNKFPLVVQTPLLQKRVEYLNTKLKEIDEAKIIFSRPRV
ncbi:unnamed protein product, partial [Sphacelaria rigidula]